MIGKLHTLPINSYSSRCAVLNCSVMSNFLWPRGLPRDSMPTRFHCPWDFSGKNTGSGCHFSTPGNIPDPAIEPASLASPALAGEFFTKCDNSGFTDAHSEALKDKGTFPLNKYRAIWLKSQSVSIRILLRLYCVTLYCYITFKNNQTDYSCLIP